MLRKSKIQANFVEMVCKCGEGVFRLIDGLPVTDSNPKQWAHRCTACGIQVDITTVYPLIEFKGKSFMLADSLRFERDPGQTSIGKNK